MAVSPVGRIVAVQAGLGIICALGFLLFGNEAGRSALLASCSVLFPNTYYAWLQQRTFDAARLLLHGVLRTLLTGVLIGVSIVVFGIEPVEFFVTFAILQLGYLVRQPGQQAGRSAGK